MQPMPRTEEIERSTSSGYLWIAIGLGLIAAGIYLVVRPDRTHRPGGRRRADPRGRLRAAGLVHAAAERGGDPAAVRRVHRHRPHRRAALGQSVLPQAEDQPARAQPDERTAESQRQARQPDRDRGRDRLARAQHRAGGVRRRGLRRVRPGPGRGGDPTPGVELRLRRRRARETRTSRRCARARTA